MFKNCYAFFNSVKNEMRFEQQQLINRKPEQEKVKINEKYLFPFDIMDQLNKKESKIRKDDKKGGKETTKKDPKGKQNSETLEMKITPLNPLPQQDLLQIQKP
jgi:hypothetical protein